MTRNGVTLYRISSGMLYRVCGGISSPRLRYRTTHQKIRPHTKTPTASAATTEPIHRSYIRCAWVVTPPGQPKPRNVSPTEHPASSVTSATAETASWAARVAPEPLGTTCSCLPRVPTVASVLDHAAPAGLGVYVSTL